MGVEALVVGRRAPPLGVPGCDFHREETAEDRVARERRRRRENAVVVRFLDVEQRRDQIAQHFPLIEPQAIDHDEHHATGALERGDQEFRAHVDRQRRPVPLGVGEPAGIALGDEDLEILAQALLQVVQRLGEPGLIGRGEAYLPSRQLGDQLAPLAPRKRGSPAAFQLAEAGDEIAGQALLANAVAFEQARDHGEHLARMHRLHEVIVDLDADRVAHQPVILALRDHHHRHRRIDRAHLRNQLDATPSRHLLVEQHDAVRLAPQHREGIVAMRRLRHREALLLEKAAVRRQAIDFVVDPENTFRTGHLA